MADIVHGARPLRSTRRLQNLTSTLPRWWKIENKAAADGPAVVSIYDEIGLYGVSAGDFLAELREINGDIEMHINSPGGDVFDGIAIYNQLRQAQKRGTVHVVVDGLAASAASFIAQAASPGRLEMAPHSQMMIHEGFAMGIGNAADFQELSAQLDKASANIAGIYADRSGKPAAFWRDMMRAETWLSDAEAVSVGLADRIQGDDDPNQPSGWDLSVYGRYSGVIQGAALAKPKPRKTRDGDTPLGPDGWVKGPDGQVRFDPDGDGDDDSTPAGDTDHDYFDPDGKQIKPVPPCPSMDDKTTLRPQSTAGPAVQNTAVDNTPWDADKAWHNGATSDDPAKFYEGICAGKKNGDPSTQAGWALPYKYHPSDAPNAAGVRNALARLSSTQGLLNKAEAQKTLEAAMKHINPDYEPGDHVDTELLSVFLTESLRGGAK